MFISQYKSIWRAALMFGRITLMTSKNSEHLCLSFTTHPAHGIISNFVVILVCAWGCSYSKDHYCTVCHSHVQAANVRYKSISHTFYRIPSKGIIYLPSNSGWLMVRSRRCYYGILVQ